MVKEHTFASGSMYRRIAVGGVELGIADHGAGEPILLVHGFPLDAGMWSGQIGAFPGFRLILPDLRGHGKSETAPPPYPMEMLAEDLRQLIDHMGIERVVLGGLSMGGYVALAFAARYPQRLNALLLLCTHAAADSPEVRERRIDLATRARRNGTEPLIGEMLDRLIGGRAVKPEVVEHTRRMIATVSLDGIVGALTGMASRPDSRPLLPKIACPTLIITGRDDTIVTPAMARAMQEGINGAEILEIPDAGHLAPLEQPGPVNAAIQGFLARVFPHTAAVH